MRLYMFVGIYKMVAWKAIQNPPFIVLIGFWSTLIDVSKQFLHIPTEEVLRDKLTEEVSKTKAELESLYATSLELLDGQEKICEIEKSLNEKEIEIDSFLEELKTQVILQIFLSPASEANRELANLTERKVHTHPYMVSKNLSVCLPVCLSVTNFDLNYIRTGEIEWAEIFFWISLSKRVIPGMAWAEGQKANLLSKYIINLPWNWAEILSIDLNLTKKDL